MPASRVTYVALLRGINVGGHSPMSMQSIVKTFERLGFKNVRTYIASGNVIFETAKTDPRKLEKKIEAAMVKAFPGYKAKVVVRSRAELETIVDSVPRAWAKPTPTLRYNVVFLREAVDQEAILDGVKPVGGETVEYAPGVLYWAAPTSNLAKTALAKLTSTKVYQEITVRTLNTAKKILALMLVLLVACNEPAPKQAPTPQPSRDAMAMPIDPWAAPAKKPSGSLAIELERIRAEHDLPALGFAAWRDGMLLDMAVVGVRSKVEPTKATIDDKWHLGSNTKAMTATLIGIYVDRGVLHWDDTLAKLFPGEKLHPGYRNVTLDELLAHRGGVPAQPPDDAWAQLVSDGTAPDARAKYVRAVLALPPGKRGDFAYSNSGYVIVGAALERATGKSWEQLMRDELFGKLGMTSCGFGSPGHDQPLGHIAFERDDIFRALASALPIVPGPHADNPPGLGPAGTVHCSLADYGKFLAVHATLEPTLVKPETLAHLHEPRDPEWTYTGGWLIAGDMLVHSGSNTMWYAIAVVLPTERLALAIVSNIANLALEAEMPAFVARFRARK